MRWFYGGFVSSFIIKGHCDFFEEASGTSGLNFVADVLAEIDFIKISDRAVLTDLLNNPLSTDLNELQSCVLFKPFVTK